MDHLKICDLCAEAILPGEDVSPSSFNGEEVHMECGFRAVAGGANHMRMTCHCYGGTDDPDPPGLSMRDKARESLKAFRERGHPPAPTRRLH